MTAPMQPDPMGLPVTVTPAEAAARGLALLHQLLHHRRPGESVKGAVGRVARLAGLDYERTREIWYGRARLLAHELMQLEARVAQREARVARLLDRLAGLAGEPGMPTRLTVADAAALAELVPGVEPWARRLGLAARALVVICLISVTLPLLLDSHADARPVKRGGPACAKLAKVAKAGGGLAKRLPVRGGGHGRA